MSSAAALNAVLEMHRPFDRPLTYGSDKTIRVCNHCLGPQTYPCPTVATIHAHTGEVE